MRNGRLQGPACVEDIDFRTPRCLDRQVVRSLTTESAWVGAHQNLFLIGPTGIGKTWLARAFAQKACRDNYTALFLKAVELFRDLATARADGSHTKLLYRLPAELWQDIGGDTARHNNGITMEQLFTGLLVERAAVIGQAAEEEVFFALERINCQPIEDENAALALEVFDYPYMHGMVGDLELQSGLRRGARLCRVDGVLSQGVRNPVKKLSIDVLMRLRDQMVAA